MNEQASGGLGGDKQHLFYLSRADIETEVAEDGRSDYSIETIANDHAEPVARILTLVQHIDELLGLFDIEPTKWSERYISSDCEGYDSEGRATLARAIAAQRAGITLGRYLFDWGLDELKFDDAPDGEGHVEVTLRLTDTLEADFIASGDYWTDYTYQNPANYEILYSGNDESEIEKLKVAGVELVLLDGEIGWQLDFDVKIYPNRNN